ncbi:glutamine amidotransferase [Terrisporobacter vanillatitrophus]|uniref:glutamine amidotransferase n=1 Tax=Terrisporobacter vanillatitrophus TaxID=3058402 RepID=UPI00336813A2
MKKIVILKMGETLDSILNKYGDFHEHIIKKSEINKGEIVVVNCHKEEEPPNLENIKGIIITGSHSMVSDYEPWSVKISQWLKLVIKTNIPVLGICYGHQILADVLGGKVGYNPKGMEVGMVDILLTEDGQSDRLFRVLPKIFKGYETHSQSVLQLPKGAKLLAYNDNDSTQSFSYENHIWGTQFHPEFLAEITKEYIKFDKENIINNGKNYKKIYNEVEEQNYGEALLKKFIEIANES